MTGWLKSIRLSTLAFALVLAYFAWHALTGQQGLIAWLDMNHRSGALEQEARELAATRKELEARLKRLRGGAGARDEVEELAFSRLRFAGPADVVVSLNGVNPATATSASPMPVATQ